MPGRADLVQDRTRTRHRLSKFLLRHDRIRRAPGLDDDTRTVDRRPTLRRPWTAGHVRALPRGVGRPGRRSGGDRGVQRPPAEPAVHRLPVPVLLGQVTPRGARPGPPQHPVHHYPVVHPPATGPGYPIRQQGLQPSPLLIRQIMPILHDPCLSETTDLIQQTRPSCDPAAVTRARREGARARVTSPRGGRSKVESGGEVGPCEGPPVEQVVLPDRPRGVLALLREAVGAAADVARRQPQQGPP